ncbi:hypothetical protein DF185_00770 [Marinifilum breve]|uniref:Anti-bacteriophage protein A/HamA C-terminal domain-containing protein n=1 Tax=Marinifilum breve TaxID=2184082 RepID=A0A2V4A5K4_9BACT|nr:DUF1837 domain-containing protein [Marinifilum breve]PXY02660.1 hypothetical protein DF185_00770 [Marinifilum breve]
MKKEIDIEELLSSTKALMKKMYFIEDSFGLDFNEKSFGTCVNYCDLIELQDEFVTEIVATVLRYVYSKSKQSEIRKRLVEEDEREEDNAYSILLDRAKGKFRSSNLQGQLSELLIFNLLQSHFKAVPILRKMSLTTNPEMERNGADAIHLARENGQYKIYIGECKTSDRKDRAFNYAFKEAVEDVIKHYKEHRNELSLYVYEDFIPEELEGYTKKYLDGDITDTEVHLVCMVTYGQNEFVEGSSRTEILENTMNKIQDSVNGINKNILYKKVESRLRPRIHLILFPVNDLTSMLEKFSKKIG